MPMIAAILEKQHGLRTSIASRQADPADQGSHRGAGGARHRRPDGDVHAVPGSARRRAEPDHRRTCSRANRWSASAPARMRSSTRTGSPHERPERRLRPRRVGPEVDHPPRAQVDDGRCRSTAATASIRSCTASRTSPPSRGCTTSSRSHGRTVAAADGPERQLREGKAGRQVPADPAGRLDAGATRGRGCSSPPWATRATSSSRRCGGWPSTPSCGPLAARCRRAGPTRRRCHRTSRRNRSTSRSRRQPRANHPGMRRIPG